jgi:hypothetical protein
MEGGVTSYLEVLYNEQEPTAELSLPWRGATNSRQRHPALSRLGGGWTGAHRAAGRAVPSTKK